MIFCETVIAPGEKRTVAIPIASGKQIDAVIIRGKEPEKTLVVTAGVHGCEYVGIETAKRLVDIIEPNMLSGTVIVLPLINAAGFYHGSKQIMPEDNQNLNRMFPGKPDGTHAEQTAYAIERYVYPHADFLIDLHGGDINEDLMPLVFYPIAGDKKTNALALEGAKALSVNYRVQSTAKNGLYSWAVQKQIPALLLERGCKGQWSEQEVEACLNDIYRIMAHLNICQMNFPQVAQVDIAKAVYEESPKDGFWYPNVSIGKHVRQGELLGILQTGFDENSIAITAKLDGAVLYFTTSLGVKAGDPLIAYGSA